jgi:Aerotolerance regulator N-terminal/von Willebrand factor type A domain
MSFLYPAFLLGALAIAIPIALHLLRRDVAPDVPFSAVRLLRRSPVEQSRRRRLRDVLLLAARVAALVLLALAFARPYFQEAAPARVRLVALDRSYSMGGTDRFERARAMARAALDEAGTGERVGLVVFDDRAEVLSAPGTAADARTALAPVTPGFGGTRYRVLFDKAAELAAGSDGRLVVVTDLQQSGWSSDTGGTLPPGWEVEIRDVGAVQTNLGVTSVSAEPERLIASIRNSGLTSRSGRLRVALDGRDVASAEYSVPADADITVPITWRPPATGAVSVSIDDPDGLAGDNARYAMLGAVGAAKALVVTGGGRGGFYLSRALETPGQEAGLEVEVVPGSRLTSMSAGEISSYPVVALLSTRGLERRGRETLAAHIRGGGGLLVVAGPEIDRSVLSALFDWRPAFDATDLTTPPVTLSATDLRHPIFRPFAALAANLGQVRFERAWEVSPDGWSVIGRFSSGAPALLERTANFERPGGRVVLFASDVDRQWNDFPLHPAFVPFALETVRHVAGDRRPSRSYLVGEAAPGLGPGPGIFKAPDNRVVAVNVDPREGDVRRLTTEAFRSSVREGGEGAGSRAVTAARQTEATQSYWQYGLLVMIAALVAESFVGRS